ncbi:MAG: sigma-54-dependent Fis family transcriptional regulator [Lentisphaerae bacterium]|nr:sigma-54-dependent Fis family transcriptional regulator [Lentisphaerota bacterium]
MSVSDRTRHAVLIVDDDKSTRDGLRRALELDYEVITAESGEIALRTLDSRQVDILLSDVRMPGMDGLTLLQRALARQPGLVGILLTAYGSVETAVEAMKRGAYDFLTKPVNLDHLEILLKRAVRSSQIESENRALREQLDARPGFEGIIGTSERMQQVYDVIRQAAPTQATVLVTGESGTGKELVARALHGLSTRTKGPFVAVHCAALSPTLLESELFGHEAGSFTGATGRRKGRFEVADGGTLFLDEISELEARTQVKLLRVLEERRFERVGGESSIETDIRLIAASNKDLHALVAEGKFREDLFFRLDVVSVALPPLRERLDDIPLLCDHFIKVLNEKNGRSVEGITPDVMAAFMAYRWPGNVRELRNTIEKMLVLSRGQRLTARDLPRNIREAAQMSDGPVPVAATGPATIEDVERRAIESALRRNRGNRSRAAKELGISRRTLHRRLREYAAETDGGES